MGETIKSETTIERIGDKLRITRLMVEDFGPEEYIDQLNALIVKVNEYTDNLMHDTKMRDEWLKGRPLAVQIRDEILVKHHIDKKAVPERQIAEVKGGFEVFQKNQLAKKREELKKKRAGKEV